MPKSLITKAGYQDLLQELRHLQQVCRPQVRAEVQEAAREGRWDKNDDYWAARRQQARVERRIQHLLELLSRCEVLVGTNLQPQRVVFNSRVTLANLKTGEVQTYHLVGEVEADVQRGLLSVTSPLGQALVGRAPGEPVRLMTPGGPRDYQVLAIAMDPV